MNNNNFDYMNYLNNIPSILLNDPNNYMNGNINYMVPNNENSFENNTTVSPYEGLVRGNLFNNLYDSYKKLSPQKLNPLNEKEAMLQQWMQYNFALIELNLYLDLNPNDSLALKMYNDYLKIKKQLEDKYESMYGSIDNCSFSVINGSWNWDNGSWPWEGDK